MKKDSVVVGLLIVLLVIVLLGASNTFLLTSKYGSTLKELDADVQWEFFHEQLLSADEAERLYGTGEKVEALPHRFEEHYGTPQTYGSYVARFVMPDAFVGKQTAFYIPFEFGSYELYVDGQLVAQNGTVGATKEEQQPRNALTIGQMRVDNREVMIVLQLANFYADRGGFAHPIQIGEPLKITERHNSSIILYFFMNGIIFIIGLFMLSFGIFNKRNKPTILLALFSLIISVRSMFARPYIYAITIFNIPWEYATKIEALCTIVSTPVAISFCYYWFAPYIARHIIKMVYVVGLLQFMLTIFTVPAIFQKTFSYLYCVPLAVFIYIVCVGLVKYRTVSSFGLFQFVGMGIVFLAALHDFVVVHLMLERPVLVQVAVGIFVTIQVVIMSWQYAQKLQETVKLNREVMELNATLDAKIKARTAELEAANAQLEILASRDALTGIGNRHTFDAKLLWHFERVKNDRAIVSLLLIDLDNFKKYNDYYGHTMGDLLLQKVVTTIENVLPKEAIFTRYGGEEFAIILPQMKKDQLLNLGNRIVQAVAQQRFEHACQENGVVTVSVGGYTMTSEDSFTYMKQLIDAADKQLYLAKNFGKNMCITA